MFQALDVLSKLQGLWVSQHSNILYVLATRVTFICAMSFDAFPLDVQTCLLQVRAWGGGGGGGGGGEPPPPAHAFLSTPPTLKSGASRD